MSEPDDVAVPVGVRDAVRVLVGVMLGRAPGDELTVLVRVLECVGVGVPVLVSVPVSVPEDVID